ncbi:argininosuccinate synthase [Reichenbachiella agariperforans]|uniref:argininosuccinate synthase n=1 Tax=Reichenbachiella agariperforans TaxID=156994 RepID=A0A1M6SNH6_REIAG|nr:argininosuccinate synthase [Reichenbachiella agariperforans]SHK46245.1 argininosuccinate synthase [Reichenbachiella agariperforans]
MSNKKVVLAFSGGLDTTYCAFYLQGLNLDVYTALVNTGGFTAEQMAEAESRARSYGVVEHVNLEKTQDFYDECLKYLIYGNVLKNNTYPLSVSAERAFQALAIAKYAKSINADYIAHGSTGAGNDQVRFDLIFQIICPDVEIITPIRDNKLSRQAEIEYLKEKGVNISWEKAKYSINRGLWGTSVGGDETLTSNLTLPEEAYPSQVEKDGSEEVELSFDKGQLKGLNGKTMGAVEVIETLNDIASKYGIGRDVHVGDTIIGIKGRVGFEAAAPVVILKAHHLLEKHNLTKWQQHWKEQLANWYGMLLHEGQFLDPVMRDIEVFLENTQRNVTGTVKVKLAPYRFQVIGIESDKDLMSSDFGQYGEMNNGWSGEDVKGFTKILANQTKIYSSINND